MSVIYKYPFPDSAPYVLSVPFHQSAVVHVAAEAGRELPTVWVEHYVLPQEDDVRCAFTLVGTGQHVDLKDWEHVGSAICYRYVWHVYRERMKR